MTGLKQKLYAMLLMLVSVIMALTVGELILRGYSTDKYFVWQPNTKTVFRPLPETMPGIEGDSAFIINSIGMRGDPFPKEESYKILTIGGSTTECGYLDQKETWPQLLQAKLVSDYHQNAWVGNVGVSGHNTRHHILQIEKLLNQHPEINHVVMLIGVNDLLMRLRQDKEFRLLKHEEPKYHQKLVNRAFALHPRTDLSFPWYKRNEIWKLARKTKEWFRYTFKDAEIQDAAGDVYIKWRMHRKNASEILEALPDMSSALEEYEHNIHKIIDIAQKYQTSITLMTQPSMWRPELEDSLLNLLWLGGIGNYQNESGKKYYSVNALANAMDAYNQTLLKTCDERNIPCLDLAHLVHKDTRSFFDDVHFNEQGAINVANNLAHFMIEQFRTEFPN